MRSFLIPIAAVLVVAGAACPAGNAQQSPRPSAMSQAAEPDAPLATRSAKKRRSAKHRRTRYASLRYRAYSPCEIIDGWRAFPTRDPHSYFDTRRVCR